jgi:hypothetical protein
MKAKGLIINLFLLLVSLSLLTVFLEIIFRLPVVKQKTGGNVPALFKWWTPVLSNELNSLGFRDQEHQLQKPDDVIRIIILGDSIVYGQMVEFDQIFPEILEAKLNQELNQKVEIINMGLMGWNTAMQLESLIENGLIYKPDLVIIAFYLNDTQVKRTPRPEEDFKSDRSILPIKKLDQWMDKTFYFYSFIKFRYNRLLENWSLKTSYHDWQKSFYDPNLRGFKQFKLSLEKIQNLSQTNQAETLFVSLNWQPGWDKETKMALAEAEQLSMSTLNMFSSFSKFSLSDIQVSPSDWHPNDKAHQIYASIIKDYIIDNNLID